MRSRHDKLLSWNTNYSVAHQSRSMKLYHTTVIVRKHSVFLFYFFSFLSFLFFLCCSIVSVHLQHLRKHFCNYKLWLFSKGFTAWQIYNNVVASGIVKLNITKECMKSWKNFIKNRHTDTHATENTKEKYNSHQYWKNNWAHQGD